MKGYRFTSLLFKIEPGEDEEINPSRYGRQLSIWLKKQLEGRGYSIEPIINEDWGRCLMCSREPFMLWGRMRQCGLIQTPTNRDALRECTDRSHASTADEASLRSAGGRRRHQDPR
jgi:hypothetical protein